MQKQKSKLNTTKKEMDAIMSDAENSVKYLKANPERESAHARRCENLAENVKWLIQNEPALIMAYTNGRLE